MSSTSVWKVSLSAPAAYGDCFADAIEPFVGALTIFGVPGNSVADITGYAADEPDRAGIVSALAAAAMECGAPAPNVDIVWLPAVDWVAVNRAGFEPIRAGRFFVHDSDHLGLSPVGAIPLRIDAATAFGTGRHATTYGCLEALDRISSRRNRSALTPVLDLGCGTGVLAIAAAKRLLVPVIASDIDPIAVTKARRNAAINGVSDLVRVYQSKGLDAVATRKPGPYGLIMANILARPLVTLAPAIKTALAPGGTVILSGILISQEAQLLCAYREQRLYLHDRIRHGEWSALVLR